MINFILGSVEWQSANLFINDKIIFSRSPKQHIGQTEAMLQLMKEAGLTIELKECHVFFEWLDFLGPLIVSGKLMVARKKTKAITALSYTTTASQIISFLAL